MVERVGGRLTGSGPSRTIAVRSSRGGRPMADQWRPAASVITTTFDRKPSFFNSLAFIDNAMPAFEVDPGELRPGTSRQLHSGQAE